jgi:hypothetical protein
MNPSTVLEEILIRPQLGDIELWDPGINTASRNCPKLRLA